MKKLLINSIRHDLSSQGFILKDDYIDSDNLSKKEMRNLHNNAKEEKLLKNLDFINKHFDFAKSKSLSLSEIEFSKLDIEIRIISSKNENILFKWWNQIWWSIPFEKAVGRQIRYFLWDKFYDVPVGLVYLSSPTINVKDVNQYLDLNYDNKIDVLNKSMNIVRFGALPPFNIMLVGKLIAMSCVSKEIREHYQNKYNEELLYVTTTGAFGKSSILNRLKYKESRIFNQIGETSGCGTFQFSDNTYNEMLKYIEVNELRLKKGIRNGSSNKITNVCTVLRSLGYPKYIYHNVKRAIYMQPLCGNLKSVIHSNEVPIYYNWEFEKLYDYWDTRWLKNRIKTYDGEFCKDTYFNELRDKLKYIEESAMDRVY